MIKYKHMKFGGNLKRFFLILLVVNLLGSVIYGGFYSSATTIRDIGDNSHLQQGGGGSAPEDLTVICQNTPKDPRCEQKRTEDHKENQQIHQRVNNLKKCMTDGLDAHISDNSLPKSNKKSYERKIGQYSQNSTHEYFGDNLKGLYKKCGGSVPDDVLKKIEEKKAVRDAQPETECAVQFFGWIICPGTRIGTGLVAGIYGFISKNLLEVKAEKLLVGQQGCGEACAVFEAWLVFRNIANVLLAIIIAVIVFSQASNVGITNYGIKRMLPRLIVFAVIINISFWIIAGLVDLTNILGYWIFDFLAGSGGWDAGGTIEQNIDDILRNKADIAGAEAATAVVIAGVSAITIFSLTIVTVLLLAVIALFLMFVILTGRQAVIIMLIAVSPVALASAILPNTEGFYKKWSSFFKSMIVIYPVCSLLIGGLILTSNVLYKQAQDDGNVFFQVVYGLLPMIGLFAVYSVIKGTLTILDKLTGGTGTFAGMIKKFEKGSSSIARNNRFARAEKATYSRAGLGISKGVNAIMNSNYMQGTSGIVIGGKNISWRRGARWLASRGTASRIAEESHKNEEAIRENQNAIRYLEDKRKELQANGKDLSPAAKDELIRRKAAESKRIRDYDEAAAQTHMADATTGDDLVKQFRKAVDNGNAELARQLNIAMEKDHRVGKSQHMEALDYAAQNISPTAATDDAQMASLVRAIQASSGNFKAQDPTLAKSFDRLIAGNNALSSMSIFSNSKVSSTQKQAAADEMYTEVYSKSSQDDLSKISSWKNFKEAFDHMSAANQAALQTQINAINANDKIKSTMSGENLEVLESMVTPPPPPPVQPNIPAQPTAQAQASASASGGVGAQPSSNTPPPGFMSITQHNNIVAQNLKTVENLNAQTNYVQSLRDENIYREAEDQLRKLGDKNTADKLSDAAGQKRTDAEYWNNRQY